MAQDANLHAVFSSPWGLEIFLEMASMVMFSRRYTTLT
jgi:hypothetical protein